MWLKIGYFARILAFDRRTASSTVDLLLFLLCNPFAANHKQWVNKPARQVYQAKFNLPL